MLAIKSHSGFTLVEIAVVMMIIALLLGGLVPTLSTQMESQRIKETLSQMEEINQALIGFALVNGRLPCPAQSTIASGQTNAGLEASMGSYCACQTSTGSNKTIAYAGAGKVTCADSSVTGVLPWASLGLKETDAWGRRYTYRVATYFSDTVASATYGTGCSPTPAPVGNSSFALCSPGIANISSAASGGTTVASNMPAVYISHGKNGLGAYLSDGTQISGASGDEAENSDNNNTFVSHDLTATYDDLVAWISPNILINRMVTAGKLP